MLAKGPNEKEEEARTDGEERAPMSLWAFTRPPTELASPLLASSCLVLRSELAWIVRRTPVGSSAIGSPL